MSEMEDFDETGLTPTLDSLEIRANLDGIGVVIADDNLQDHSGRAKYLEQCGATVKMHRVEGMRNHAAEINNVAI